jgi:alkanesulfonate monooxygenase SsuD/methylene tetrahydromethanopterin reductase-like flavin-dependent oxidoreductase (luciferase family)
LLCLAPHGRYAAAKFSDGFSCVVRPGQGGNADAVRSSFTIALGWWTMAARTHGKRPDKRVDLILCWCDSLDEIRDEARGLGDDFLAYLVELALEQAVALAMKTRRLEQAVQDQD